MRLLGVILVVGVVACGPPGVTLPADDAGVAVTGPTWAQDVAPLVSQHCSACHVEGGIAPFALTTFEQAQSMAGSMVGAVQTRRMPPWMPGGATPALEHSRRLTDEQIAVFAAWLDTGTPEGDTAHPATLPPPETIAFDSPDISVDTGVDYVPDATLTDDYRCFLVDLHQTDARMATAFRVTPGNRKTVHHVIVTLFAGTDRAALEQLDASQAGPGWQCFGGPVPTNSGISADGSLGSWVPGVSAVVYPVGTATRVPAGSLAVVQVHYNLQGGHDPDRTAIEVKLAPLATQASLQPITGIRLIQPTLSIPPGSVNHVEERTATAKGWTLNRFFPDGQGYIIGVAGHMHTLGQRIEILRHTAAGADTLLDIPAWDFHWQGSYQFQTPIPISPTDSLTIHCEYDNPGTSTITWGEGTADEMCLASLQVIDQLP